MDKGKILKDLFAQKKYTEVIDALETVYCGLFEEMLNFRNVSEEYKNLNYRDLKNLINRYYPEFYPNTTILSAVSSIPYYSYLDIINTYMDNYEYMKNNYKKLT